MTPGIPVATYEHQPSKELAMSANKPNPQQQRHQPPQQPPAQQPGHGPADSPRQKPGRPESTEVERGTAQPSNRPGAARDPQQRN